MKGQFKGRQNKSRGFSLIELILVMAVFMVVMGAVLQLLAVAQQRYQSEQDFLASFQNARQGVEHIRPRSEQRRQSSAVHLLVHADCLSHRPGGPATALRDSFRGDAKPGLHRGRHLYSPQRLQFVNGIGSRPHEPNLPGAG